MRLEVESMSDVSQVGISPARTVAGVDEQLTEGSVNEEGAAVESSSKPAEESVDEEAASGHHMAQSQDVHLQSSTAYLHATSMASMGNSADNRGDGGGNSIPPINSVTPGSQTPAEGSRKVAESTSSSHDRTGKANPQDLNRPRFNSRSSRIEALLNETSEASEGRPHAGFSSARQTATRNDQEWWLEALSSAKSLPPGEDSSRPHSAVAKRRRSSPSKLVFLAESALHLDEDYTAVGNVRADPDKVQQNSAGGAGVAPVEPMVPPGDSEASAVEAPVKSTLPSGDKRTNALVKEEEQQQSKSPEGRDRATARTVQSHREPGTSGGRGDGDALHNQDVEEPHQDLDRNPSSNAGAYGGQNDGEDGDVDSDDDGSDEDGNADDDNSRKTDQKTPSKGGVPSNYHTPRPVVLRQGKRDRGKGRASESGQSGRTSGKRSTRPSDTSSRKSRRKTESEEAAELEIQEDSSELGRQEDRGATYRVPSTRRTAQKSTQRTESSTESGSAPRYQQKEEETDSEKSSQEESSSGFSRENRTNLHSNRKRRKEKEPPAVKKERKRGRAVNAGDNLGRQRETDKLIRRKQLQQQQVVHDHALKDHNWMPLSIPRSQPVSAHYLSHLRLMQEERRQDMEAMRNSKCGPIGYEWSHWADSFSQSARRQWLQGLIDSRRLRAMKQAMWPQKKNEQGTLTRCTVSELSPCSSSQFSTAFPAKWGCVVFCTSCMRGEVPRSVDLRQSTGYYNVRAKEKSKRTNRILMKSTNRTLVKSTNRTQVTSNNRTPTKTTQRVIHSSRQRVKRKQVLDTGRQKREPKVKGGQVQKRRERRKLKKKLATGRRLRAKRVHSHPVPPAPPAPVQKYGVPSDAGKVGEDAAKAAAAVDLKRRLSLDLKGIKSQVEARGATKLKVSSRKSDSTKETSQSASQRNVDSHGKSSKAKHGDSQRKSSKAKQPTKTAVIQLQRSSVADSTKVLKKEDDSATKDRGAVNGAGERKESAKSTGKKGGTGGTRSVSAPVKESKASSKRESKRVQQQGQKGSKKGPVRPRTTRTGRRKVQKPKLATSSPPSPRRIKTHRLENDSSDEENEFVRSHSSSTSGKPPDTSLRMRSDKDQERMRKGAKFANGSLLSRDEKKRKAHTARASSDEEVDSGRSGSHSAPVRHPDKTRVKSGRKKESLHNRSKSRDRATTEKSGKFEAASFDQKDEDSLASSHATPAKQPAMGSSDDEEEGKGHASMLSTSMTQKPDDVRGRSGKEQKQLQTRSKSADRGLLSSAGKDRKGQSFASTPGTPKRLKLDRHGAAAGSVNGRRSSKTTKDHDTDKAVSLTVKIGSPRAKHTSGENAKPDSWGMGATDGSPGPIGMAGADRQGGDDLTGGEIAELDRGTAAKDVSPGPIDISSADGQLGDGLTGGEVAERDRGMRAKDEFPGPIDIASAEIQGSDDLANKNILSGALPIDVQQSTISTDLSTPASLPDRLGSASLPDRLSSSLQAATPFEDTQDYVQENIEIDGFESTKHDAQEGDRAAGDSRQGVGVELPLSLSPTDGNVMKQNKTPSQEKALEVQDWKMARFFSSADAQSLSSSPPNTPGKTPRGYGDTPHESDNKGRYRQLRLNTSSSPLDQSTPRSAKSVRPSTNPQVSAIGSDAESVGSHNRGSHTATTTSRKSGKSSPASFVVRVTVDRELFYSSGPRKAVSEGATPRSDLRSTAGGKPDTAQTLVETPGSVAKSESALAVPTPSQTLSNLAFSGKSPRDEGTKTNSRDRSADGPTPSSQDEFQPTLASQNRPHSAFALGRVSTNLAEDERQGTKTSRSQDGTRQSYGKHDRDHQSPSASSGYASRKAGKQQGKRRVQISENVFHSDGTVLPQKHMAEESLSEVQSSTNRVHFGPETGIHDDENDRQGYESDFEEQYVSDFESDEVGTRVTRSTRRATPYPDSVEMLEMEDDEDQLGYRQSAVQRGSMTPGRLKRPSRQRLHVTSKSEPTTPRRNLRPKNDWKNNGG